MRAKKVRIDIFQPLLLTFSILFVIVIIWGYQHGLLSLDLSPDVSSVSFERRVHQRRNHSKQRLENNGSGTGNKGKTANDDRIIMHEVSGRSFLLWRQTCSLESVARNNPDRPIHLFISAKNTTSQTPWMDIVRQFKNIEVILLNNADYFNRSPFEAWYRKREWLNSLYEIAHMSTYIKMLTLSRGGGLIIDMDMIIFKRLDKEVFKNVFAYSSNSKTYIDASVFHLETGHRLMRKIIDELARDYDSDAEIYNGSIAIEQSLKDVCGMLNGNNSSNHCTDVTLLPHSYFYPIGQRKWKALFEYADPKSLANITESYGIHTFLSMTNKKMTHLDSSQLLAQLARKYCPSTVSKALLYHHRKL